MGVEGTWVMARGEEGRCEEEEGSLAGEVERGKEIFLDRGLKKASSFSNRRVRFFLPLLPGTPPLPTPLPPTPPKSGKG